MVSFTLYQTAQRLYIVRHSRDGPGEHWRVLRVDRTSAELAATEDPTCYTKPQLQRVLAALNAGVLQRGADAQDKWWRRCRSVSCCCCTWARLRTARYTPSGQPLIPQPARLDPCRRQPAAWWAAASVRGACHHRLRAVPGGGCCLGMWVLVVGVCGLEHDERSGAGLLALVSGAKETSTQPRTLPPGEGGTTYALLQFSRTLHTTTLPPAGPLPAAVHQAALPGRHLRCVPVLCWGAAAERLCSAGNSTLVSEGKAVDGAAI